MPIEATGLVLEAQLSLYVSVCDDVVKLKTKQAFENLVKSVNVLSVCEWPDGCAIQNVSVACAQAVYLMVPDMAGLHGGGINVIGTSHGATAQGEVQWPQISPSGDIGQSRVRREEAGPNTLGHHHHFGYTVNITFSFALNFSADSLHHDGGYDWMTYLGSKELHDSAVFMETQIESRLITLEVSM